MTIHNLWPKIFKGGVPSAFTPEFQGGKVEVVCIDGMPCLMAGSHVQTWDDLVNRNFLALIQRYYRLGASTVVLQFDDYTYCANAKGITQANRNKVLTKPFEFDEFQLLERVPPPPQDYNRQLRNRLYKRRVIQYLTHHLPSMIGLKVGQSFIIDHDASPVRFSRGWDAGAPLQQEEMADLPPKGENDIKFTRWYQRYGNCIAHSVDGDYLLIALIEYEKRFHLHAQGGPDLPSLPNLTVRRLRYKMEAARKDSKKRKAGDDEGGAGSREVGGGTAGTSSGGGAAQGREWEYVSIPQLYHGIKKMLSEMPTFRGAKPRWEGCAMRILGMLVGFTGTDFSRKLPFLTPPKLWKLLETHAVAAAILSCYDPETRQMDVRAATDKFASALYRAMYPKYTQGNTLEAVLSGLQKSRLAPGTKDMMPSEKMVETTCKNVNWLMLYWECREPVRADGSERWDYAPCFPDAICEQYGFKRGGKNDAVKWLDDDDDA